MQSAHLFNKRFVEVLLQLGFQQMTSDPCIFMMKRGQRIIIIAIYVDDTIIAHKSPQDLQWVMKMIAKSFKFKNLGTLKCILGLHVGRSNGAYWINQEKCILRMAEKCNIYAGKRAKTPITTHPNLDIY